MALNVGLDESFGNMQDWKGIRKKAGKTLIKQMTRLTVGLSTGVTLVMRFNYKI
jgi:hypothetical protein